MTRKKGIALIICLTLIISMVLPGTLAFSGDPSAANENLTLAEDTPVPTPENSVEEKGCTCDPKPAEGEPHGEGCPFYTSVMGTAAAAEGTDSPVTEPAAGHIRIKINVFCVDDSNEAIPQPGVRVEVRRELYGDYDGENAQLSGWNDELPMFSGTSDEKGVVEIEVPYTVVKYPDNAANDTAYLGNGETNDNDHVVYQRRADTDAFCIRFAIEPVNGSGYALNGADQKIRNWKNGQNGINVHSSDGDGYAYDDFVFQSGLVDIDSQTGTAGGAFVEFDLYVKKTVSTEEPTTEEPTKETVNINYVPVGPAGASFGSVDSASETVMVKSGTAVGSTPAAASGFKFVGWFKDQACTQPVDATWIENNKIIPQKTTEAYEAATYYAKFDYAVADLTIKQDGGIADENQTFIYVVTGGDLPESGIKVAVKGNSSVTIRNLKIGSYTVTEETNWNWRCGTTGGSQSITLQGAQTNEVRFTNTVSNSKWLSGNAYSVL
jgi:hypothetical protein